MKKIKNLLLALLALFLTFGLFYLSGSFYSCTFQIIEWGRETRAIISFAGTMFSIMAFVITFIALNNNED